MGKLPTGRDPKQECFGTPGDPDSWKGDRLEFLKSRTDFRQHWDRGQRRHTQTEFVLSSQLTTGPEALYHSNYLGYLDHAWRNHYGVTLLPDHIWFDLLCELAMLVKAEPERFRHLFTESDEKTVIRVMTHDVAHLPLDQITQALQELVPMAVDSFLPVFSTTTAMSRLAMMSSFAEMASPFYDYETTMCGIPRVKLGGTLDDWELACNSWTSIAMGYMKLHEDPQLSTWVQHVELVLNMITLTLEGTVEPSKLGAFWKEFYNVRFCGSGGDDVSGWYTELFRDTRERPGRRTHKDFVSHATRVEYRNVETNRRFVAAHGLFSSIVQEGAEPDTFWLEPRFGEVIMEVRAAEAEPVAAGLVSKTEEADGTAEQ